MAGRRLIELAAEQELAVSALTLAVLHLPTSAAQEVVTRVGEQLLNDLEHETDGLSDHALRSRHFVGVIRSVAVEVGGAPLSTEYIASYKQRKQRGEAMPSLSAIVKHFGSWPHALLAAGFSDVVLPPRIDRRRRYRPKRVAKFSDERLIEALHACARDLGRIPTIRDYRVWHETAIKKTRGSGYRIDIPAWRTLCERFGGWLGALAAAGFPTELEYRSRPWPNPSIGCAKTAIVETERRHGGFHHGAEEGIEGTAEAPLAAREAGGRLVQGGDGRGVVDPAEAAAGGVRPPRSRGRARLVAVPDLATEPGGHGA